MGYVKIAKLSITSDLGAKLRQLERKVNASQQAEQQVYMIMLSTPSSLLFYAAYTANYCTEVRRLQKFAQELDESKKELTKVCFFAV